MASTKGYEVLTESVEREPIHPLRIVQIYSVYPGKVIYEPFNDFPELLNLQVHKDNFEKAKKLSIDFYNLGPKPDKSLAKPIVNALLSVCEPEYDTLNSHDKWEKVALQLPGDIGGSRKQEFIELITQRSKGKVLEAMTGFNSYITNSPNISSVTALDYSKEMLLRYPNPERTRIVFDLNRISKENIKMNFFKDNEFNTITCCYGVNYLKEPLPVFQEFRRILSPEGKFLVLGCPDSGYPDIQERIFNPEENMQEMQSAGFTCSLEKFINKNSPSDHAAYYLLTGVK